MLLLKCRQVLHIAVDSVSKAGEIEAWMKKSDKAHETAKAREKAYPEVYISVHFTNKSELWEAGGYSKCTIPFACVLSCK